MLDCSQLLQEKHSQLFSTTEERVKPILVVRLNSELGVGNYTVTELLIDAFLVWRNVYQNIVVWRSSTTALTFPTLQPVKFLNETISLNNKQASILSLGL